MEDTDRKKILNKMKTDIELRKLYGWHKRFERELDKFKKRAFLTSIEEYEIKKLKMRKLRGVEKMLQLVA